MLSQYWQANYLTEIGVMKRFSALNARAREILCHAIFSSSMTNERAKSHFAMGKHKFQALIRYS